MKLLMQIFLLFYSFSANANVFQELTKELPPTDSEERAAFFKVTDISIEDENGINNMAPLALGMTQMAINERADDVENHEYSKVSLKKLSKMIDNALPLSGRRQMLPTVWGYYLGNTLVKNFRGKWKKMGDGTLAILMPNGEFIFPVNEAYKHAGNGKQDAIFSVYETVELKMQVYEETTITELE